MKKVILIATMFFIAPVLMAQETPIVDQYGRPTGYRIQTQETSASLHDMLETGQAINAAKNAPTAAVADGIAEGIREGYRQANEDRRLRETAAQSTLAAIDKDHLDRWILAQAELAARIGKILDMRCAEDPKAAACSVDRHQISGMVDAMFLNDELVLIPRDWWVKNPKKVSSGSK